MMGLYNLKDFLTFEDVADYLTDKGVYEFDISQSYDRQRLNDFLKELALDKKIDVVFSYFGRANLVNYDFYRDQRPIKEKVNYFTVENRKVLLFDVHMFKDWLNGNDFITHDFIYENSDDSFGTMVYRLFGYNYENGLIPNNKENQNTESPFIILLDDNNGKYGIEPLFPKSQLDKLFLQQQKDKLQNQINSIDSQLDNKELTATSQKAVAKLLYALLKEHEYELGAKKGTTNDVLERLTIKHGVNITRETIAKWLDIVNTLDK